MSRQYHHANAMMPHSDVAMASKQWGQFSDDSAQSHMGSTSEPPVSAMPPPGQAFGHQHPAMDSTANVFNPQPAGVTSTSTSHSASPPQQEKPRRKPSKASSSSKPSAPRQLQFVNATDPYRNRDPEVRMLVRSHVMKGVKRDEKAKAKARERKSQRPEKQAKETPPRDLAPPELEPPRAQTESSSPDPVETGSSTSPLSYGSAMSGASMSLYGTSPLTSRPESHRLLFYYRTVIGSAVYPFAKRLAFNPVDTSWIPLALSDDVFFSTILFSSASHLSFIQGQKDATLPSVILSSVFRQLGERLGSRRYLTDATVGAVTCLAQVENMRGNHDAWRLHMNGLLSMIQSRGIDDIDEQMQLKIYRADVEGAVNFVTRSQLPPITRNQPPLESAVPAGLEACLSNSELIDSLTALGVRSELVDSIAKIYRFSRALEYVLMHQEMLINPASYDEDVIVMQLELVSISVDEETGINRALRLACMMYVKSAIRGAGVAPPSSRKLLVQLKDALLVVPPERISAPVHLWMLFIGAVGSRGLPEHFWYLQRLRALVKSRPEMQSWEDAHDSLRRILWVEPIHGAPCRIQWDEIGLDNGYTGA